MGMSFRRTAQPVVMIVGSCMSLQLGAALAVPLLTQFGAGLITSLRLLLASLLLMLAFRPQPWKWNRSQWLAVALFGASLAGMNTFFYASIARIPLGIAVTIEFAGPLLLAAVLSRQLRDFATVIAAALAIVMLGVDSSESSADDLDRLGIIYALVAAAFWALYIVAGKRLSARVSGHGPLPIAMLAAALVVVPFSTTALPELVQRPDLVVPILGVAIFSSFIPYSLEFAAMRSLSSRTFGVLLSLEPAIAAVMGWIFLQQPITPLQGVAIAVVITASIISTLGRKPTSSEPADRDPDGLSMTATP